MEINFVLFFQYVIHQKSVFWINVWFAEEEKLNINPKHNE